MEKPAETKGDERVRFTKENERNDAKGMPAVGYMTVKSHEIGPSVAVAARKSLVFGIQMNRFIIHFGGTYSKDICAKRIEVQALNGILFATVKLKQVFLRDRGEETDTGNCALPLHGCQTATKDGAKRYKELFDHLAKEIIEFRCRLLTIDANMSMWAVVPEMRARGVQISL